MAPLDSAARLATRLCRFGVAAGCALAPALALAQPTLTVMEARVEGQWTGVNPIEVEPAIHRGLDGLEGFEVRLGAAPTCHDSACRSALASKLDTTHLLEASIDIVDRDVEVRLEVFEARGGRLVASTESSCEVCADNEVTEMLTSTVARLCPRIEGLVDDESTLVIDGSPRGAELMLDGEDVGTAPFRGPVTPGPHQIVVTAEGYESYETAAYTEPGQPRTVEFSLRRRSPTAPVRHDRLRAAGVTGAVSTAMGLGAIAAGVTLLTVHGRPVASSCPDIGSDINGRCPRMYDTLSGGVAAVSVGGTALVTGVVLIVLDRIRARRSPTPVALDKAGLRVRF